MLKSLLFFFFLFFMVLIFEFWYLKIFLMMIFMPFMFFYSVNSTFLSKNSYISLDIFSFMLIFLTLWVVILSIFSSFIISKTSSSKIFISTFSILLLSLIFCFLSHNLIWFFFFFESSLIPILVIVVGWGYKIERLKSGIYLFFYTLFGSIPMMSMIFFLLKSNNQLNFQMMELNFNSLFFYFFLIFGFLIKMPMFLVHSWLPNAHVEAPVSGSMILAGILLKLGGYGIFRLSFIYKYFLKFNSIWMSISIWGGILSCFICLRQSDMKSLIAFSSVNHMSLVILGLLIFKDWSILGSFLMMFSHGLCSSCMFFLSNVVYERSGTRSIFLNKGLLSIYPSMSMWWFIFCSFNMSAPPSLNLISEIFLINSIFSWSFFYIFFLMFMSFLGGAYNLFLFSFSHHGKLCSNLSFLNSCVYREHLICFMHFIPLAFLFLKMELFFN